MEELLRQLQELGYEIDPNDPRFQRIYGQARTATLDPSAISSRAQRMYDIAMRNQADLAPELRAQLAEGPQVLESVVTQRLERQVLEDAASRFLTETGQSQAQGFSDISRRVGDRLRNEAMTDEQRAALVEQQHRLSRFSQGERNRATEQDMESYSLGNRASRVGREIAGRAGSMLSSPVNFARHVLGDEQGARESRQFWQDVRPTEELAPDAASEWLEQLGGGMAETAPFLAAGAATLGRGGPNTLQAATNLVGRVPGLSRVIGAGGGGGGAEMLRGATRGAIGGAGVATAETAALDPYGTFIEGDPKQMMGLQAIFGTLGGLGGAAQGYRHGMGNRAATRMTQGLERLGEAEHTLPEGFARGVDDAAVEAGTPTFHSRAQYGLETPHPISPETRAFSERGGFEAPQPRELQPTSPVAVPPPEVGMPGSGYDPTSRAARARRMAEGVVDRISNQKRLEEIEKLETQVNLDAAAIEQHFDAFGTPTASRSPAGARALLSDDELFQLYTRMETARARLEEITGRSRVRPSEGGPAQAGGFLGGDAGTSSVGKARARKRGSRKRKRS